ncbi:MAG: tyrosine--tRNA ligase, partial [Erysipelotrichales bacterium]|nr:tyrosine--tRNA ligase [Erysipelotrichales bacterium]
DSIKKQLSRFLDFSDSQKTIMLNNYDWLSKIDVITFLRDYGKNFPINYMLAKDTVASRLESGISFTEFSYMIVQSIDFYNLYKKENCRIQLGGSDQWGNITSGAELIRRLDGDTNVVGITMPLITKSDGTKFGKSSGGSFWLDAEMTSPYTIYQYFLNTSDQDVIHYLKVFTFYSKEEIEEFANKVKNSPELREAQKALAKSLVIMLHGEKAME